MLSRVQCLHQLYILESLPESKMNPFPEAVEELERLKSLDISEHLVTNHDHLKIMSLNTRSLTAHFKDILSDQNIMSLDIICLQETWLHQFENETENFAIEGKKVQFNNRGKGKGIATFYPPNFELQMHISEDGFQITSISSSKLNIINIYRSKKSDDNSFIKHLDQLF